VERVIEKPVEIIREVLVEVPTVEYRDKIVYIDKHVEKPVSAEHAALISQQATQIATLQAQLKAAEEAKVAALKKEAEARASAPKPKTADVADAGAMIQATKEAETQVAADAKAEAEALRISASRLHAYVSLSPLSHVHCCPCVLCVMTLLSCARSICWTQLRLPPSPSLPPSHPLYLTTILCRRVYLSVFTRFSLLPK
jgi:hypothetical protein